MACSDLDGYCSHLLSGTATASATAALVVATAAASVSWSLKSRSSRRWVPSCSHWPTSWVGIRDPRSQAKFGLASLSLSQ
jgi:hypothetical protein